MERKKRILKGINLVDGIGLEIGPLTSPILSKEEGNISYADHMSRDELIKKYANEPVEPDKIVDVDIIIKNGNIKSSVKNKKFDYIVASHVIEHIPDIISWLNDLYDILKPNGVISLVIPDKRATFDINRRESTIHDVVGAYLDQIKRPYSSSMHDYMYEIVKDVSSVEAWAGKDYRKAEKYWSEKEAEKMCSRNLSPNDYVDCHCYVFTPYSFSVILRQLLESKYIKFFVEHFEETHNGELEFYVSLRKPKKSTDIKKLIASVPAIKDETFSMTSRESQMLATIEKLQKEMNDLLESRSWKITKPIRLLVSKIEGLKNA